ncbi:LPS-assembly protein LptD [Aliikangiella sp. IMCC44632]
MNFVRAFKFNAQLTTYLVLLLALVVLALVPAVAQESNLEPAQQAASPYYSAQIKADQSATDYINQLSQCGQNKSWQSDINPLVPKAQAYTLERSLSADAMPVNNETRIQLTGNVEAKDSESWLRADKLTLEKATQVSQVSGNVRYESAELFFSSQQIIMDEAQDTLTVDSALFYLFQSQANGTAQQLKVTNREHLALRELSFSTCPVEEPAWQLTAERMEIDQQNGVGEAWGSVLRVKDVPVIYLPYISFPTDDRRKTGLLTPSFNSDDRDGVDFSLPFYWNLAPHADLTIAPRYIEKRGSGLEAEVRYMTTNSYTEYELAALASDRRYLNQLQQNSTAQVAKSEANRWFSHFSNKTNLGEHWSLNIDTQRVSDIDYFRDFSSGIESANETQLASELRLNYQDDIWQLDFFTLSHQSLIGRNSYQYLPSFRGVGQVQTKQGLEFHLSSEATRFHHRDPAKTVGQRYHIAPSVSFPKRQSWGFIIPKLSYWATQYQQEVSATSTKSSAQRSLPLLSVDSGLYFERGLKWGAEQFTQTLEPRLFYAYVPYREQTDINVFDTTLNEFSFARLWQVNRFNGIDRVGDTNQISLSVTNRILSDRSGDELASFTIGRQYQLSEPRVQLSNEENLARQSPWLAQAKVNVANGLSVAGLIDWDPDLNQTNRAQIQLNFEPKTNHIVNLSHRYRDLAGQMHEELDFAFALPVNERWRLLGRWYNDLNRGQLIEALAGVEYESCCWVVRIVAQKFLNSQLDGLGQPLEFGDDRYQNGVSLQFIFKGLGSAGKSGLKNVLQSSIVGYQDIFKEEKRNN